jgi:hypothetical protein
MEVNMNMKEAAPHAKVPVVFEAIKFTKKYGWQQLVKS